MHKLRLNLEELAVETFTTDAASSRAGTVHGQELPYSETTCYRWICECPTAPRECGTYDLQVSQWYRLPRGRTGIVCPFS